MHNQWRQSQSQSHRPSQYLSHRPSQPLSHRPLQSQSHRSSQMISRGEPHLSDSSRLSRIDKPTKIPRMSNQRNSFDRMSGVHCLDKCPSASRSTTKLTIRNRSVDSLRKTINPSQLRMDSGRLSGQKRPRSISSGVFRETPVNRTPSMANIMMTPMSGVSFNQDGSQRTPSNERPRLAFEILDRALSHTPSKEKRSNIDSTCSKERKFSMEDVINHPLIIENLQPEKFGSLKSISTSIFLDITIVFLSKIWPCHGIVNLKNYVEKIPEISAKLSYTGNVTKSWLKSVYASHTHTNMLSFFEFLVDLNDLKTYINDNLSWEKMYGIKENNDILMARHQLYINAWREFQELDFQNFEPVINDYIETYKIKLGVSEENKEMLKSDLEDTKRKLEEATSRFNKIRLKEKQMEEELTITKNRSEQLKEMEKDLKSQSKSETEACKDLENSIAKIDCGIPDLEKRLVALQSQLKCQKMSLKERDAILKEIDYLKECSNSQNNVLMEVAKLSFEKDIELAKAQREALQASTTVNTSLMKVGLIGGKDLTSYSLNERDLLLKDTSEILQKTIEKIEALKEEAKLKLEKACQLKVSEASLKQNLQKKIEMALDTKYELEIEIGKNKKISEDFNFHISQLEENFISKCKVHKELENKSCKVKLKYEEAKTEFEHWKEQHSKWKRHICELKKREQSSEEIYRKQAEEVILEYIEKAKHAVPDIKIIQN